MMKPLFAALAVAFLLGTSVSVHAAEQAKPTDRSVQVYKKADLAEWNRENAAGGKGPLLGTGKQTPVGAGDITIARPGQSHALKNTGKEPLVFLDLIAETAAAKSAAAQK